MKSAIYILFLIIYSDNGVSQSTTEFSSQATCEAAAQQVGGFRTTYTFCVAK